MQESFIKPIVPTGWIQGVSEKTAKSLSGLFNKSKTMVKNIRLIYYPYYQITLEYEKTITAGFFKKRRYVKKLNRNISIDACTGDRVHAVKNLSYEYSYKERLKDVDIFLITRLSRLDFKQIGLIKSSRYTSDELFDSAGYLVSLGILKLVKPDRCRIKINQSVKILDLVGQHSTNIVNTSPPGGIVPWIKTDEIHQHVKGQITNIRLIYYPYYAVWYENSHGITMDIHDGIGGCSSDLMQKSLKSLKPDAPESKYAKSESSQKESKQSNNTKTSDNAKAKQASELKTAYEILGLEHGVEFTLVKKRYKELALKYDPSRNMANQSNEDNIVSNRIMREINHAYGLIKSS